MADTDRTPPRSKTVKHPRYEQKCKLEHSSQFKSISKSRVGECYGTATLKTANRHVFCKYVVLTIFGPKLTNSCLALLAGLAEMT